MCELMGMCFAHPLSADFSIHEFANRGEENAHGWGLAWYPDRSAALVKEPLKWGASQFQSFLEQYRGLISRIYIAHVRHKTTGGEPTHADTHPFSRELAGRDYCFAHNGTLLGLPHPATGRFLPIGLTDSEQLFCLLLERVAADPAVLDSHAGWDAFARLLGEMNRLGRLNCLLTDGRRLFCYHDIHAWKGLSFRMLHIHEDQDSHFEDCDIRIDLSGEPINYGVVVATAPFSTNGWHKFLAGELLVLEAGRIVYSSRRDTKTLLLDRDRLKVESTA